jgi:HAD superfamily hydrolase (TIGR01509 family)
MIKSIFFDIGGVLIDVHPERTAQHISSKAQIPYADVLESFPHAEHHKYEKGQISSDDFYNAVINSLPSNSKLQESDFWDGWLMMVGAETDTSDILKKLKKSYPVWIVSNTNQHHIQYEAKRFTFVQDVNGTIYSFDVNSRKPEPEIYHKALEIASALPNESLFIDDQIENIVQARSIGFHGIHYTSYEALIVDLRKLGVSVA